MPSRASSGGTTAEARSFSSDAAFWAARAAARSESTRGISSRNDSRCAKAPRSNSSNSQFVTAVMVALRGKPVKRLISPKSAPGLQFEFDGAGGVGIGDAALHFALDQDIERLSFLVLAHQDLAVGEPGAFDVPGHRLQFVAAEHADAIGAGHELAAEVAADQVVHDPLDLRRQRLLETLGMDRLHEVVEQAAAHGEGDLDAPAGELVPDHPHHVAFDRVCDARTVSTRNERT